MKKEYTFSPFDVLLTDGSVTSDFIANAAIGSAHIQNAAINSANIADAAITSAKIAEAAVGTAAIQNAAITKAHLKTAIIDTAHIIDGAITNAKIGSLSADKITSGTINAINITGSLIRGGRFEPLNESSAYTSYIEGDKIYQRVNTINYGGTPEKTYSDLTITSGDITLAYGGRDTGTDEPLRTLRLRDGSIYMSGNVNDTGYSEQQMFCNDKNYGGVSPKSIFKQRLGGVDRMSLHSWYDSVSGFYNVELNTKNSQTFAHWAKDYQLIADGSVKIYSQNSMGISLNPSYDGKAGKAMLHVGNAGEVGGLHSL